MEANDRVLLERWVSERDAESFSELAKRYAGMVYGTCMRVLGDSAGAEDVSQECFEILSQSGSDAGDFLGPWLHRVATTRSLNRLKAETRRRTRERRYASEQERTIEHQWDDLYEYVDEAIEALPEKLRLPILAHFFEGQTHDAIAKTMNAPRQTVTSRIQKGIKAIRRHLVRGGISVAAPALAGMLSSNCAEAAAPATLVATLSKIALAGPAIGVAGSSAAGTATAGTMKFIGGVLIMKKLAIAIAVVVCVSLGYVVLAPEAPEPQSQVSQATATVSDNSQGTRLVPVSFPSARPTSSPEPRVSVEAIATSSRRAETEQKPEPGTGILRVEVIHMDGSPAIGASIEIELMDWKAYEIPPESTHKISAKTDHEGKFEAANLAFGSYGVLAFDETGFMVKTARMWKGYSDHKLKFKLKPAASISGRVVDRSGNAVPNAAVYPNKASELKGTFNRDQASACRGRTDENGNFVISHLNKRGRWQLCAVAKGYSPALSEFYALGETSAEIVLDAGLSCSGQVVDSATQSSLENIKVVANTTLSYRMHVESVSDSEGRFVLTDLAEGEYSLDVDDPVYVQENESEKFNIVSGKELSGLRIELVTGGTVFGRVYDKDTGEGISGVNLSTYSKDSNAPIRSEYTDSTGIYQITGLATAPYEISYSRIDGYPSMGHQDKRVLEVKTGEIIPDLDFPISKGICVRGIVVDNDGNPVEKASVSQRIGYQTYWVRATSASDGSFELMGLKATEKLYLKARTNEMASRTIGPLLLPDEGLEGIILTLEDGGSISGKVVDTSGNPIISRDISAYLRNEEIGNPSQSTDSKGRFRLPALTAGTYDIKVSPQSQAGGFREIHKTVELGPGEHLTDVVVIVDESDGFEIAGRVTNTEGNALQNAWAFTRSHSTDTSGNAQTDKNGYYKISGLDEGIYYVDVSHNNYSSAKMNDVEAGSTGVDFVLEGCGAIEGRVVSAANGESISNFQIIQLTGHVQRWGQWMNTYTFVNVHSADGSFSFSQVDVGEAAIIVKADGFSPGIEHVTGIEAGQTIKDVIIKLEAGLSVEGIVKDTNGSPISGAWIFIGAVPSEWDRERFSVALSDSEGGFRLDSLSHETKTISAYHGDYASASVLVDPAHDSKIEIVLSNGGIIEGQVTLAGRPLDQQLVQVYYPGSGGHRSEVRTNHDGTYQINGLDPGRASVSTSIRNNSNQIRGRSASQEAVIENEMTTTVDFHLDVMDAVIEGNISIDGVAAKGARVRATIEGPSGLDENWYCYTDKNGYYVLEPLPAGEIKILVRVPSPRGADPTKRVTVTAVSGRTVRQDIDFSGGRIFGHVKVPDRTQMGPVFALEGKVEITEISMKIMKKLFDQMKGSPDFEDYDGSFTIAGLESGTYTIVSIAFDEGSQSEEEALDSAYFTTVVVELAEGAEVELELTIE